MINENCQHCFEAHRLFDYNSCVLENDEGVWIDYAPTGKFIEYKDIGYGFWECTHTEVKYFKMCGKKLR